MLALFYNSMFFFVLHVTFVIANNHKAEFMTNLLVCSKNPVIQITLVVNHKCWILFWFLFPNYKEAGPHKTG